MGTPGFKLWCGSARRFSVCTAYWTSLHYLTSVCGCWLVYCASVCYTGMMPTLRLRRAKPPERCSFAVRHIDPGPCHNCAVRDGTRAAPAATARHITEQDYFMTLANCKNSQYPSQRLIHSPVVICIWSTNLRSFYRTLRGRVYISLLWNLENIPCRLHLGGEGSHKAS